MSTKSIFLLCMWLLATCFVQAQDKMPQAISYQAVARDAQGKVIAQKPVGVQVEILKGSTSGTVVFSETHSPTSSQTGTINLLIGQGSRKTGAFSSIDWGADTYYLQLSMDLTGGSNYAKVSTTQMLPVPYALYAAKAGTVENGGNSGSSDGSRPKFMIVQDYSGTDLYSIIAGELEWDEWDDSIDLDCTILYLDGKDQHLNISIDGLPEGSEMYYDSKGAGKSSSMGRTFDIGYKIPSIKLPYDNLRIVIKDEVTNRVVKEYPFKIVNKK